MLWCRRKPVSHKVAEIERGLESLQRTRDQIRQAYTDIDPDVAEIVREDEDAMINISVSFDGTWQKRGFTSHYGIGVCIDILTGLVVDFEVLSSYCHACTLRECARRGGKITREEFESWKESHVDCAKNFSGSSKAMEQEAAKRMWARSVSQHQLRYTEMLSDGDSAAFKEVVALNPYPGHEIVKLECINHAQKRMGTALRKLSAEHPLPPSRIDPKSFELILGDASTFLEESRSSKVCPLHSLGYRGCAPLLCRESVGPPKTGDSLPV
ncbi:hypothetical protein PO909_029478 [Leuciscus waleckii]